MGRELYPDPAQRWDTWALCPPEKRRLPGAFRRKSCRGTMDRPFRKYRVLHRAAPALCGVQSPKRQTERNAANQVSHDPDAGGGAFRRPQLPGFLSSKVSSRILSRKNFANDFLDGNFLNIDVLNGQSIQQFLTDSDYPVPFHFDLEGDVGFFN